MFGNGHSQSDLKSSNSLVEGSDKQVLHKMVESDAIDNPPQNFSTNKKICFNSNRVMFDSMAQNSTANDNLPIKAVTNKVFHNAVIKAPQQIDSVVNNDIKEEDKDESINHEESDQSENFKVKDNIADDFEFPSEKQFLNNWNFPKDSSNEAKLQPLSSENSQQYNLPELQSE